jgi:replicative DNA helicase
LALNFDFAKNNAELLSFIDKFHLAHSKFPEITTVKEEFPAAIITDAGEPFDYYFSKLAEAKSKRILSKAMDDVSLAANSGDIMAAIQQFTLASERFKGTGLTTSTTSLTEQHYIDSSLEEYREKRDTTGFVGIPSGIENLDAVIGGFTEDDFVMFVARPRSYKTWTMLRMALRACREGKKVLLFTKEMRRRGLKLRLDALLVGEFPYNEVRLYKLTDENLLSIKTAWQELADTGGNLLIAEVGYGESYDMAFIISQVLEHTPDIVFIDGAYLLSKSEDWKDQTAVSRGLKDINSRFRIPVVASTQFSRKKTNKGKMDLDDAAYSDAYGQDASIVIGMSRDFDSNENRLTNKLRLQSLKIRESEDNLTFGIMANLTSACRFSEFGITEEEEHATSWAADAQVTPLASPDQLAGLGF